MVQMINTGIQYLRNFISNLEEQDVVSFINTQDHWGRIGQKRRLSFGWEYGVSKRTLKRGRPIPLIFRALSIRLCERHLMNELAEQVVVQEYKQGQGIDRHIDLQPQTGVKPRAGFGPVVVSVSLLSPCVMRFSHPVMGRGLDITLEPQSAVALSVEMRTDWLHEIVPSTVRDLRISITFRTVVLPVSVFDCD